MRCVQIFVDKFFVVKLPATPCICYNYELDILQNIVRRYIVDSDQLYLVI